MSGESFLLRLRQRIQNTVSRCAQQCQQKKMLPIAAVAILGVAGAAGWWWQNHRTSKNITGLPEIKAAAEPKVTRCYATLENDVPAIVVQFNTLLDRRQDLNAALSIFNHGKADAKLASQVEPSTPKKAEKETKESKETAKKEGSKESNTAAGKRGSGDWAFGEMPMTVVYADVTADERYRVEIKPSLKFVGGKVLSAPIECELASRAQTPAAYFASKGSVLPAGQNGGLPVATVNVPEIDVEFMRVPLAKLPEFFSMVQGSNQRGGESEEGDDEEPYRYYGESERGLTGYINRYELKRYKSVAQSVYLGRFQTGVDAQKANSKQITHLPVEQIKELQEPGIYIAILSRPGNFEDGHHVTYFFVSDIGLHARKHEKSFDVFASSLRSGSALSGVELEVLDQHAQTLLRATTNGDGHAALATLPPKAAVLLARDGKQVAMLSLTQPALDLSEFDIAGHLPRDFKLFAYSGRDLYRPGEQFQVSVLARNSLGMLLTQAPPLAAVLKRPDGKVVSNTMLRPDANMAGYYQRAITVPADAQTGAWTLELRADPAAKAADSILRFSVEEFLPERLKLNLQAATTWQPNEEASVRVKSEYLYGAPAAGNRLLGSVSFERQRNPLPQKWPGFEFGDATENDLKKRQELEETTLDNQGEAEVAIPFAVTSPNNPILVKAFFSVLESGGRPVVRNLERTLWPSPVLIGVRPLFPGKYANENSPAEFELVRVTNTGEAAAPLKTKARLIREDREYYWRYDANRGWHSGFTESDSKVSEEAITLQGRTKLRVPVGYGRYRLEVEDTEHGTTLKYRFYAGYGAMGEELTGNRPDIVRLRLETGADKKLGITPGKAAKLTILPPHEGEALITIEADKVLYTERLHVPAAGKTIDLKIEEGWQRSDMYITATVFRPGSAGDRVTPARAVGLLHVPLDRRNRQLQVAIQAPAKTQPEKEVPVTVKVSGIQPSADGKTPQKAYVTLSAVDVGILNITHFKSPDPFDFFYGKHRYEGELHDSYGRLIEKMEGTQARLKFGGDAGMRESRSMPKKVQLVDLFSGVVAVNANGEATIPLKLPDFNGTLRLMAVAQSGAQFGKAEQEMISSAPIVAELSLPRFISAGDDATLALDLTNMTTTPQQVSVNVLAGAPVSLQNPASTVALKPQQRTTLRFTATATEPIGVAPLEVQVQATGGAQPIKLTRKAVLTVTPAVAPERQQQWLTINPGTTLKLDPTWIAKYYPGSTTIGVTLSTQPPIDVADAVKGLLTYPYGCVEQTTSSAYPHLIVDDKTAAAYNLKIFEPAKRTEAMDYAIGRLAGMQGGNGGFSLWGGSNAYDIWISSYATQFLIDAAAQGYNVPANVLSKAEEALLQALQEGTYGGGVGGARLRSIKAPAANATPAQLQEWLRTNNQALDENHRLFSALAHASFVLSKRNKAPLATLRQLHDEFRSYANSPLPLVQLGLALRQLGDKRRAEQAFAEASKKRYGREDQPYWWAGDYGSALRDNALSAALLSEEKAGVDIGPFLQNTLAHMRRNWYYSTQERIALLRLGKAQQLMAGERVQVEWARAGKTEVIQGKERAQLDLSRNDLKDQSFTNKSSKPLYLLVNIEGYVKGNAPEKKDVVELTRRWYDMNGTPIGARDFKVGESILVRVTAKARLAMPEALLVDRIPAGFEVENMNLSQGEQATQLKLDGLDLNNALNNANITHQEFRDDRYVAAIKLRYQQDFDVVYKVRVVTPGRYVVPPPHVEDMYRADLFGRGASGQVIRVVDGK